MFHLFLNMLLLMILTSCVQTRVIDTPPSSQALEESLPAPTVTAAEIELNSVVVSAEPLRIAFPEPLFAPGAALPRASMLETLTDWFDFLRLKPDSHWLIDVTVAQGEVDNPVALATARADLLSRLLQRQGLRTERFSFTPSSADTDTVIFRLK